MDGFSTERLTAERLAPDHLDALIALHLDPDVSRFLGGVRAAEQTRAYLATNIAHWDDWGFGLWALRSPAGDFVGRAGLRWTELEGRRELEIAYALARGAWGRGLASETARALITLWRTKLDTPSLVGLVSPENTASARVLAKSGFAHEGRAAWRGDQVDVFRLARAAGA
jgi:RimJ/RimL family protein N-acetyltransferase